MQTRTALPAALLALAAASAAHAQPCAPAWQHGLNLHGVNDEVTAVFQSLAYSGTDLFIGGLFNAAGSAVASPGVARWNGQRWIALAPGIRPEPGFVPPTINQFMVYDDGSGPALFVCGTFKLVGDQAAPAIAKWDGAALLPLPDAFAGAINVSAMAVFDEGAGPRLYIGGIFRRVNGFPTHGVAKWNGSLWSGVGSGFGYLPNPDGGDGVSELAVFDDGALPRLYAVAHGLGGLKFARLEAGQWVGVLGAPAANGSYTGYHITAINTGPARGLYFWGPSVAFTRFDGVNFTPMPASASSVRPTLVQAIETTPPILGVARRGSPNYETVIEYWDGSHWTSGGPPLDYDDTTLGFSLPSATGGVSVPIVQRRDAFGPLIAYGNASLIEPGLGSPEEIRQVARYPSAPASPQYAICTEGSSFRAIRTLGPEGWATPSNLGAFVSGLRGFSLVTLPTPGGERLVAVGSLRFQLTPPFVADFAIALFDGATWSPLGRFPDTSSPTASAAATFDSGAGPDLYVAGVFSSLDAVPLSNIARRTPTGWDSLSGGINGFTECLAAHDDGSGPALFVGGNFSRAGPITAHGLARWNGQSWSALPSFTAGDVRSLLVARENNHEVLYAAGEGMYVSNQYLGRLAKYDRGVWSRTLISADASPAPLALTAFGDGPTQFVLAAGSANMYVGPFPLGRIAIYDGVRWSGIAADIDGQINHIMADDNASGGVTLTLAGDFTRVNNLASTNFARIDLCSLACPADTNGDRAINMADLNNLLDQYGYESPTPEFILPADLNADGVVDFIDLNILLSSFGLAC